MENNSVCPSRECSAHSRLSHFPWRRRRSGSPTSRRRPKIFRAAIIGVAQETGAGFFGMIRQIPMRGGPGSRQRLNRQPSRCGNPYQVLCPTQGRPRKPSESSRRRRIRGRAEFASCGVRTCDTAYFNMFRILASETEGSASRRASRLFVPVFSRSWRNGPWHARIEVNHHHL